MNKKKDVYPNIDLIGTGLLLKNKSKEYGYSVKDIQNYLNLSCPQPVYRWYKGMVLPSVDNLYLLSILFNVHMEDLLVPYRPPLENECLDDDTLEDEFLENDQLDMMIKEDIAIYDLTRCESYIYSYN